MARYVALNSTLHAGKGWRHPDNLSFAASEAVVPVVGMEFGMVATTMPIAFIEQARRFVPYAVLSLMPGHNLFVGPNGQWLGTYTPAALRTHPFRAAQLEGRDGVVLCIDEESGLIVEPNDQTEPLFTVDGQITPSVQKIWQFLTEVEANRVQTALAVTALADAGVMRPWLLKLKIEGQDKQISGLYRIDETALNAVDDGTFLKLRRTGALPLAYLQLQSMAQVSVFERLDSIQKRLAPKPVPPNFSLDELFGRANNETLRFD